MESSQQRLGRIAAIRRAARAQRANFFRALAAALIIYGSFGLAAALYGYSLVREAFVGARNIGAIAPGERNRALSALQSMSTILADAATTSSNLTSSFRESETSLTTASQVAADVATSFREVARVSSIQIFGLQPLAGMAQPFIDSSQQLDLLATDLSRTSTAINANANDMRRIAADFGRLKTEVDGLAQTVSRLPTDPTTGEGAQRLETALSAMLVWIGLQGVAAIFSGLAILFLPIARQQIVDTAGP